MKTLKEEINSEIKKINKVIEDVYGEYNFGDNLIGVTREEVITFHLSKSLNRIAKKTAEAVRLDKDFLYNRGFNQAVPEQEAKINNFFKN